MNVENGLREQAAEFAEAARRLKAERDEARAEVERLREALARIELATAATSGHLRRMAHLALNDATYPFGEAPAQRREEMRIKISAPRQEQEGNDGR